MIKRAVFGCVVFFAVVTGALADNGLIVKKSAHSVAVTLDRLEKIVTEKGATIFARINHGAAAQKAGIALRPTELLIFGNPKGGSPLMVANQQIGIDLPLKVLAWQDEKGQVWIAYNRPDYLAQRHALSKPEAFAKMGGALKNFTDKATAK